MSHVFDLLCLSPLSGWFPLFFSLILPVPNYGFWKRHVTSTFTQTTRVTRGIHTWCFSEIIIKCRDGYHQSQNLFSQTRLTEPNLVNITYLFSVSNTPYHHTTIESPEDLKSREPVEISITFVCVTFLDE